MTTEAATKTARTTRPRRAKLPAPCHVALDTLCQAAPEAPGTTGTTLRCSSCGNPVCASCSAPASRAPGAGSRSQRDKGSGAARPKGRLCASCEEAASVDGAARVLRRRYHRAGYRHVTLAGCRAQIKALGTTECL
jgi:hypothetical protein